MAAADDQFALTIQHFFLVLFKKSPITTIYCMHHGIWSSHKTWRGKREGE